ncbi:MAG: peptidylprolyl isomerase [Gemmataceae bacterium]|nr:peptidylprolyl isomerase [Gemmataceae bacterium]
MFSTLRKSWAWGLLGAAGFVAGRLSGVSFLHAADPVPAASPAQPAAKADSRYVAYLNGGRVPITREELGEYLIARYGQEKVELLVNKVIIDTACKEKGIEVSDAEIEAALADDLKGINVNRQQFVDNVLKQYGKTLYEWKYDVLKPRLQLSKLCKLNLAVSEEEIRQAFEAQFGPKVEGRIIIWPKEQTSVALKCYEEIRTSADKFEEQARQQANPTLASVGGRIKPIGKGSGTHPELEKEVFKLKEGQITTLITTNEGIVCFRCDRHVPADENVKLDSQREALSRWVLDRKLNAEIPKQFKTLRDAAGPVVLLKRPETREDLERNTQTLLQAGATEPKKK